MTAYVLKRVLSAGPVLLLISIGVFAVIEVAPGDPVLRIARRPSDVSSEQLANLRAEYGLDDAIPVRYLKWLSHAATGDLGYSYTSRRPVVDEILDRLPNTIILVGVTLVVVVILSLPIGMVSAVKQYSMLDIVLTTLAFAGQAIPEYWLGSMLIWLFHGVLASHLSSGPLFPIGGMCSWDSPCNLVDRLQHLILPVATLAFGWMSVYTRFLRSSALEILHQDYITVARAKGLPNHAVLLRHVFKNAGLPLVTLLALDLPLILAGALYVEIVFSWPGVGRLFYNAAQLRDYPLLMAIAMMISTAIVLCNLLADVGYAYLDPRVRFGGIQGQA